MKVLAAGGKSGRKSIPVAMEGGYGKADMNLYGMTEGARPYRGGGASRQPWDGTLTKNRIDPDSPVQKAGDLWARGQMSNKEFKKELKKHGYSVDLRRDPKSSTIELEGPEGFTILEL